jgi:dodecin
MPVSKSGKKWRWYGARKESSMSVARVVEISATSTKSFEGAIQEGLERVHKTLRNVTGAWIKDQRIALDQGKVTEYQVNMVVTFILDDTVDQTGQP